MPAPKSPEFRRRAVELARLREKPIAQIAKDLGIAESGLRRWMKQADIDEGKQDGLSSDERPELIRRNVQALGGAMRAIEFTGSPAVARAVAARERVYAAIEGEFGLLTSAQVADRMGSRAAAARRNLASQARKDGRLLGLRRGRSWLYPGFQFDAAGARPVIAELRHVGERHGWDETSVIEWLMGPTTYLDGGRPVDVLDDPERVLRVAEAALGVSW